MTPIKYLAAVAAAGAIPALSFAAGPMHAFAGGLVKGTISSVSGNTVTMTVDNAANLQAGDTIGLIDQALGLRNGHAAGKVTAVNGNTITLQHGQNTVNVQASSSTAVTADGQPSSLSSIVQGAFIRVKGAWDSATNTLDAASINIMTHFRAGFGFGRHHQATNNPSSQ